MRVSWQKNCNFFCLVRCEVGGEDCLSCVKWILGRCACRIKDMLYFQSEDTMAFCCCIIICIANCGVLAAMVRSGTMIGMMQIRLLGTHITQPLSIRSVVVYMWSFI